MILPPVNMFNGTILTLSYDMDQDTPMFASHEKFQNKTRTNHKNPQSNLSNKESKSQIKSCIYVLNIFFKIHILKMPLLSQSSHMQAGQYALVRSIINAYDLGHVKTISGV